MNEQYVSFETAKLLKEKGFNEHCPLWYDLNRSSEGPFFYKHIGWYGHNSYDYNGKEIISAPTQALVMRWLRETHGLYVELTPYVKDHNVIYDYVISKQVYKQTILPNDELEVKYNEDSEEYTYEEACEVAIKYCLINLI